MATQISSPLPAPFQDLEPFVDWALAKESQRTHKRLASTIEEIQAFYEAMLPRIEAIMEHLNQFPLEHMPADAERLFHMSLSLIEVSMAVELFKQPGVINGFDVSRFVPIE